MGSQVMFRTKKNAEVEGKTAEQRKGSVTDLKSCKLIINSLDSKLLLMPIRKLTLQLRRLKKLPLRLKRLPLRLSNLKQKPLPKLNLNRNQLPNQQRVARRNERVDSL